MDVEQVVAAVVGGPVGAGLFVAADQQRLGVADLADPATVSTLASIVADRDLDPWTAGGPVRRREWVLDEAARLRPLVATVVSDPRTSWWWAPLDRDGQLALTDPATDTAVTEAVGPATTWEIYAQRRDSPRLETSTELAAVQDGTVRHGTVRNGTVRNETVQEGTVRSGLHAQLASGSSDWQPEYPLRQTRLVVAGDARVYEVTGPSDWHRLARTYGDPATYRGPDRNLLDLAGIEHGLGPTWSRAAADWDAVHLTFGGFITARYVPVTSGGFTTTLWSWESERTLWLREAFTAREVLADLIDEPSTGDLRGVAFPN